VPAPLAIMSFVLFAMLYTSFLMVNRMVAQAIGGRIVEEGLSAQLSEANARLVATIGTAGFVTTALVGRAPDLSWSEDCIAVRGASLAQICAWGRAFDQHAVFLLTEGTHAVVSCWSREVLGSRERVLGTEDPEGTA